MPLKLGEMLLQAGAIRADQLDAALGRQRRFGGRLATSLLALGHVDERTLCRFLSRQQGVPFVVLSQSAIPLELVKRVPLEVAREHLALPVHQDGRDLFVALANPKSIAALDELRFVTGARVVEHGALIGPLGEAIEEAHQQIQFGSTVFWEGAELDPTLDLAGDVGHVAIVVGHHDDPPSAPAPIEPTSAIDGDGDWVEALQSGQVLAAPVAPHTPTVLVVDDEPELRNMLGMFLDKSGYEVWEAADGKQAEALLKQKLPDAIVLDAMLPGVHGFDICYRVKNAEATRHVPVIMISAVYRGWRYAKDVKSLYGADAFLEKPLRLDELKHTLQLAIDGRQQPATSEDLSIKASVALQQAAVAFKKGDLPTAARQLEDAVAAAPFSAQLHHRLGLLYEKLEESYRAIAALERAAELEGSLEHILALARLYEKTGFLHKAYESWERCLRATQDPKQAENIKRHMDRLLL
jgi:DNA-binding response OmpR family regulator